ncbi:hypothetical protein [Terrabacter sp. BE26]|uniref:hypothetical protein n=1 Tax=Terrabacter sp. BE26 TaxID=2898152 RepID=UPI0035BE7AAF
MEKPRSNRRIAVGALGLLVLLAAALLGASATAPGTTLAAPDFTSVPADPTSTRTNTASWTHPNADVRFRCSLDDGPGFDCSTPLTWTLDLGKPQPHRLSVLAVDGSGAESRPATYAFSYREPPRADAVRFSLAGDLTGLVPGVWREVPVRVTNPSGVPIRLTGVTLTVGPDSIPPGCLTATNLEVRQPVFAAGRALPVPPRATVTLPTEGVAAAAIILRDLPSVNQDVCKNKSFTLVWSGTAEQ